MRARNAIRAALCACVAIIVCGAPAQAAGAGTAPITVPFDHLATGFELDGVHRDLPCESCHLNAVFKGTPRDCGTCHITGSVYNATPKVSWHIQSSNNCAACHDTNSFRPGVHFNHAEVMGACVSCHNGTIAQGEGPTHPATSQNCAACHTVLSWNPPSNVDHTQIPLAVAGFCIICHNGVQASGKPAKSHRDQSGMRRLPPDHELAGRELRSYRHRDRLLQLPQRRQGGRQAGHAHADHQPVRELPHDRHRHEAAELGAVGVRSHADGRADLPDLPQRHAVKIYDRFRAGQPTNHVPPILPRSTAACATGTIRLPRPGPCSRPASRRCTPGLPVSNCCCATRVRRSRACPRPTFPCRSPGCLPPKRRRWRRRTSRSWRARDCSACHGAAYQAGGFGPATAMSAAKHAFVTTTCDTCHDTGKSYYVGAGTPLQLRPPTTSASADTRMATGDCSVCHETMDWVSTALPAGHLPNPAI